jgi:hypothetical protein
MILSFRLGHGEVCFRSKQSHIALACPLLLNSLASLVEYGQHRRPSRCFHFFLQLFTSSPGGSGRPRFGVVLRILGALQPLPAPRLFGSELIKHDAWVGETESRRRAKTKKLLRGLAFLLTSTLATLVDFETFTDCLAYEVQ